MSGYIRVPRSIFEEFGDEPYCKRSAWLWMIAQAAYEDHEITYQKEIFIIRRGEFFSSLATMAKTFKWSKGKVRRFLTELENSGRVKNIPTERRRNEDGTTTLHISVQKYHYFSGTYEIKNTVQKNGRNEDGTKTERSYIIEQKNKKLKNQKEKNKKEKGKGHSSIFSQTDLLCWKDIRHKIAREVCKYTENWINFVLTLQYIDSERLKVGHFSEKNQYLFAKWEENKYKIEEILEKNSGGRKVIIEEIKPKRGVRAVK